MYCENCGHKLNSQDLFCEECGNKINKNILVPEKNSNKTLWIILGCVLGGILLFGLLFIILMFSIFNYTTISEDDYYGDRIEDIIDEYENVSSIDSI